MLAKHLIVKTNPKPNEKNVVTFGDYRVTILFDRLFRIEKNMRGEFFDHATQSVWFRDTAPVAFEIERDSDCVEIKTEKVTLHLDTDFEKSYIVIDGERCPINNDENLLGTTRTLDCFGGDVHIKNFSKLKLDFGVCSRNGVAVINDTQSLRLMSDGKLVEASSDEFDVYVFCYKNAYREALRALYAITGATPMLPRYAFGNWWSRYHAYTDEEYLNLMDSFDKYGIPLTVATIDMDWHWADFVDEQKKISASGKISEDRGTVTANKLGWTGYSWNTELFPDPKGFLRELRERNLKVTLNLHPADGVRYFEDMYEEMALAMGVDPKTEKVVEFDIANDDFVNNYFKILHHPHEADGVDFWWIDWQQGTKSAMAGLDPLWALNHYHYYDNGRDGKHPLIMSRYAGIGSHRYPIGFSGDTSISWATLSYMPYFTSTSANAGYTWWGHDIGGHFYGEKDDELYLRFLQFGVFNPINRLHCCNSLILTKEPWAHKNGVGELAREAMVLRHRMIPMLYTANYRTATEGRSLIEPMYYAYPECAAAYEAPGQYVFASDYVVAPIAHHSEEDGLSRVKVWIPEGRWTDIFTGDIYNVKAGGKWVTLVRSLDSIPVLARAGAVLPLGNDKDNTANNPSDLELQIFNGNNTYELYEDDGKSAAAFTKVENTESCGKESVKVSFSGDLSVLPEHRDITFTFKNIVVNTPIDAATGMKEKRTVKITVTKNGKPIDAKISKYDTVSVKVSDIDYSAEYVVTVEYSVIPELCEAKRAILMKLLTAEGSYTVRNNLEKAITRASSMELLLGTVKCCDLSDIERVRLAESLIFD